MKIILENGGGDFDQLVSQITQGIPSLQSRFEDESLKKRGGPITPPVSNAKMEIQKNNQQSYI